MLEGYFKVIILFNNTVTNRYVLNSNPDQSEGWSTQQINPPKARMIHFNESIMQTPNIKKTTRFFSKLPNIEFTSFMTENTSNSTVYSGVKQTATSLFSKNLQTESRNKYSLASAPRSINDLYEVIPFRDKVIPRAKQKSMLNYATIKSSTVILPKIIPIPISIR